MFSKLAVIGHPIGHSMSPYIHQQLFALKGRTGEYRGLDISPEDLPKSIEQLQQLDGFNVTIPHKQSIIPLLHSLDSVAKRYGSVNTVVCRDGQLLGCNTDAYGFIGALKLAGIPLAGRVLLCGCGGVACTIALECALRGCAVTLAVRDVHSKRANALKQKIVDLGGWAELVELSRVSGCFELAVNATPLGMYPNVNGSPLRADQLQQVAFVFDTVFNPAKTQLLLQAEQLQIPHAGGMGMLVLQAAEAQRLWYGATFTTEELTALIHCATEEMQRRFAGHES